MKRVVFYHWAMGVKCQTNKTRLSFKTVSRGQDRQVTIDLKGLKVKWFPIRSREQLRVS